MYQDPWSGSENVDVGGMRLPRVGMGMHVLRCLRCTMPKNGDVAFIAEFEVVQSTNIKHAPGSQCSVYITSKFKDSLQAQVKALVAALYGYDPKDDQAMAAFGPHTPTVIRRALASDNPLEGRTVGCEGIPHQKTNPKTGEPYVNYAWSAIEEPGALPPPGASAAVPPGWRQDPTTGQWVPA